MTTVWLLTLLVCIVAAGLFLRMVLSSSWAPVTPQTSLGKEPEGEA